MNINSRTSKINFTGYASGNIASFTGLREAPIKVIVYINAIQEGSGDPAPDNIRPIIGHNSVTITANAVDHIIQLGDTYYGCYLDVTTGVLTITHKFMRVTSVSSADASGKSAFFNVSPTASGYTLATNSFLCNRFKPSNYSADYDNHIHFANASVVAMFSSGVIGTTTTEWNTWLANNEVDLIYELATPITVKLTPTQMWQIIGSNSISSDSGNVEVYYVTI